MVDWYKSATFTLVPIYNKIGVNYNNTRKADPVIGNTILSLLRPAKRGRYLDVGCGTGNYTHYIEQAGYDITGIDPSDTMLVVARQKYPECAFITGYAEDLPFEDSSLDGAIAIFTFHHWSDKQQGLNELHRVLRPGGTAVFLSFTAEQMQGYWLTHYFPEMIARSGQLVPARDTMCAMFKDAGFKSTTTEKYFVHEGLQDHFLYANKFHPERYLDNGIRNGISSFSAFASEQEVTHGLRQLEDDIRSQKIGEIMDRYTNDMGDYLFYVAEKGNK